MGVKRRLLPLIHWNRHCSSKNQYLAGNQLLGVGETLWLWLEMMLVAPTLGNTLQSHPKMLLYLKWDLKSQE